MKPSQWYSTINRLYKNPQTERQDVLNCLRALVEDRDLTPYDKGYVLVGFSNQPSLTATDREVCMIGAEFEVKELADVATALARLAEVKQYLQSLEEKNGQE